MFRVLGIPLIYTMEASFCGANQGEHKDVHFTTELLMNAGKKLCQALTIYMGIDVQKEWKSLLDEEKKEVTTIHEEVREEDEPLPTVTLEDIHREFQQNKD